MGTKESAGGWAARQGKRIMDGLTCVVQSPSERWSSRVGCWETGGGDAGLNRVRYWYCYCSIFQRPILFIFEITWTVVAPWPVIPVGRPWLPIISIVASRSIISIGTPWPVVAILTTRGRIHLCKNRAALIAELRSISP
jgi:hypothetical protein